MKIIFLDIDGVLNSDVYMSSQAYIDEVHQAGVRDHKSYAVVLKAHHTHLDPAAVQLMNQLVEKTGATVVLSSSWRTKYSDQEMTELLKSRGATFTIDDRTPLKFSYRSRQSEVQEYLRTLKEEGVVPESFVILDDIEKFPAFESNFIQTFEVTGLTPEDVNQAIEILNIKD